MLKQVAEGVLVHESEFIQSNSVVVKGRAGVLLIDPGITGDEMAALANDIRELGQPVVAGFSTHPDWDHVLWHANFGDAPRYGTARCAASIRDLLSNADWMARIAEVLPPEFAEDIPMDLLGLITGLPAEAAQIPWDGPKRHPWSRLSRRKGSGTSTNQTGSRVRASPARRRCSRRRAGRSIGHVGLAARRA
jgi:glyoxylase-like metal-dependent hydrolase (beta-lactamase superfamily II)